MPTNRAIICTYGSIWEHGVDHGQTINSSIKIGDIDIENQSRLHVVQLVVTSLVKHPNYLQRIYYLPRKR